MLAAAAQEQHLPLLRKIITHGTFDHHVTEISFPAPVVLTRLGVGAVPSSAATQQHTQLLLFAQDAGAPASARYLQLCPGFEQPQSGTKMVELQQCVTARVMLRGWYQTLPLSLYGHPLALAAAAPPLPQQRLSLRDALHWLQQQQQEQQRAPASGISTCFEDVPMQTHVAAVLQQLVAYWDMVGTSERLMALNPPPTVAFKAAAALADVICAQLGAGSFGREPITLVNAPLQHEQVLPQQPGHQQQVEPQQAQQQAGQQKFGVDGEEPEAAAEGGDQLGTMAAAVECPVGAVADTEALLDAAADLVLGWCGMLGAGAACRTNASVRCSMAGLAAAVLLCSCSQGAQRMVSRWGVVLLDDVLTMPGAPASFVRYSTTACLLIAWFCGTQGSASLLGLRRPTHGIVWQSQRRQQQVPAGVAANAAAFGAHLAAAPVGGTDGKAAVDDQLDGADEAEARSGVEQHLYATQSEEDEDAYSERKQTAGQHDLLIQHWQQDVAQQRREEELLYAASDSDGDFAAFDNDMPDEQEQQEETAALAEHQAGEHSLPSTAAAASTVAAMSQQPADMHQQQSGSSIPATAGAAALEAEEFGGNVYTDLRPAEQQQQPTVCLQLHAAPQAVDMPVVQPHVAGSSLNVISAAADAADGDDVGDELYGDLGLQLGLGPTIPQTDGAADSPPRHQRNRGADPGERWEMGGDKDTDEEQQDRHHRYKSRSRERSKKRRKGKDKKSRRDKDRSRERQESGRDKERGVVCHEDSRSRDLRREAAEREREKEWQRERVERLRREGSDKQQRQEAEERLRRRHEEAQRKQQQEGEERRRRYQEQQRRLDEEQRRLEQEEHQKQRHRTAEQRRLEERRGEEQHQRLQQRRREEEPRRKRERSPAVEAVSSGRQQVLPGKQQRTDAGPIQLLPFPAVAQHVTAGGPELPSGRKQEDEQQQKRQHQQAAAVQSGPRDMASKWTLHEQQQQRRMKSYWQQKEKAYEGCAKHVVAHLLQKVQPQRLVVVARQLLHLLRAHEAAATFEAAADQLVQAHVKHRLPMMPTPEVSMLVADCGSSLQQLAELLAKPLPSRRPSKASFGPIGLTATPPPPALLDAICNRRLLPLLAAVLHVPMAHRSLLEQQQATQVAAPQPAAVIEAALQQQLAVGAKPLLAVLASSRSGQCLLLSDAAVLEQLLLNTDASCLADQAGWRATAVSEGAALLQHLVLAEVAVAQLCRGSLEAETVALAAETASALLHESGISGRRALVQALSLRAPIVVPRLLLMLHLHCILLRSACTAGFPHPVSAQQDQQDDGDGDSEGDGGLHLKLLLATARVCAHAPQLLLALTLASHVDILGSWQLHARSLQLAAATEMHQLEALPADAAAAVAGLGAAKSALSSLKGAATAVLALQQPRSLSTLLTYLGAELPAFLAPVSPAEADEEEEAASTRSPVVAVRWSAVEALFCHPEKLACCEQCLHLLSYLLWTPGPTGRATALSADAEGALSVLLRGVLTGTELMEASAADSSWQVLAGQSIDAGEAAACRRRALSFLEAAAAAMSSLLQHLRGSTLPVNSTRTLVGLLRAHAALCSQEESLSCMLGGKGGDGFQGGAAAAESSGMEGTLVARYHLASCLRCYLEAAQPWQPLLLQQMFWGTPAPGLEAGQVAAQTPAEMFATACLLGDLLPTEWPAAGRKATQAPPTDRKYRAALATAIEPCSSSFRRLVAASLTSESRLLRAAVVRVVARASGLGGGMGPFLVEPLVEELQAVVDSPAPLHDARRLLEVIVPLVYRPAIKSALLLTHFTSTLAQLLGVVVGKLLSVEEGVEAAHVCTMAMEAVMVLCNHEICLNPLASKEQQQLDDMPPLAEAMPLARALLELLPGMGTNAMIAHRVLRLMAAAEYGRQALRRAVVAVHAEATGAQQPAGQPGTIAVAQAAQWVANRYWAAAERLSTGDSAAVAAGGLDALRTVYTDMFNIMQQICVAANDSDTVAPVSAQQRFVTALQAALQAAAAAGLDVGGNEHRWEGPGCAGWRVAELVHDPATRMFWRNVRARTATQSQASSTHAMRRFARWEVQNNAEVSLEASLHPPLTLPRQPPTAPPVLEHVVQVEQQLQSQQQPAKQEALDDKLGTSLVGSGAQAGKQQEGAPAANADVTATATSMRAEQGQLQRVQPMLGHHSMDLYDDLGLALHTPGAQQQQAVAFGSGVTASANTQHIQLQLRQHSKQPSRSEQQQEQGRAAGQAATHQDVVQEGHGRRTARPLQRDEHSSQGAVPSGGKAEASQHSDIAVSSATSLQSLLSNPAALQALLRDPAQVQQLLEKHPVLILKLKAMLNHGA